MRGRERDVSLPLLLSPLLKRRVSIHTMTPTPTPTPYPTFLPLFVDGLDRDCNFERSKR